MNLSAWALKHQSFVLFLILLLGGGGVYAYMHLGQMEDPSFTVKAMVVQAYWPGATAKTTGGVRKSRALAQVGRTMKVEASMKRLMPIPAHSG